jgi:amino acid adenylation domain-containing protein
MPLQVVPLHPSQQDVYMDQVLHPDSPQNINGGYIRITGNLDREKFKEAVISVPDVFDVFKFRFDFDANVNHAFFDEDYRQYALPELDFSAESMEYIEAWMYQHFNTAFAISKEEPSYLQYLIKVSDNLHLYFFKCHHLLVDGYGISCKFQYMARKYKALVSGADVKFVYASYKEEAIKAAAAYNTAAYREEGKYWKNKIPQKPAPLLQKKQQQTAGDDKRSETHIVDLPDHTRQLLEALQVKTKSSLQQLTIAAFIIYFSRIHGRTEYHFGMQLHKRRNKQLRSIAGMFTGLIPFKGIYKPGTKLVDMIREISVSQREDYRYQNYLLGDLVRELRINGAEDYLLEVMVNNAIMDCELDFGEGIEAIMCNISSGFMPYPLELSWFDYGRQQPLQLRMDYQLQYFNAADISLLWERVRYILQQFPDALEASIDDIDIIPAAEKALLAGFNHTVAAAPAAGTSLITMLAEQALRSPDAIAVMYEGAHLTYRALHERSNQLAHYLQRRGIKANKLVPLCMERSLNMLVAIIGIMKAGAAYVPIDPGYPEERIRYILEDTGAYVMLSSSYGRKNIPVDMAVSIIMLDSIPDIISNESVQPVTNMPAPGDLAYLIYTSGSTGKPKGVMVEHAGMLNHLFAKINDLGINASSVIAFTAPYTFDISVWQMLAAIACGGITIIYPDHLIFNPAAFIRAAERHMVTILELVPSYLAALLKENTGVTLPHLEYLLVTGETVSSHLLQQWFGTPAFARIPVVNAYGPTEASDDICHYFMYEAPTQINVPLGKPIQHMQIYVVGPSLQMLPIGVAGEICVSGIGVSRGYLNRPELTREKFIIDPFITDKSVRMYRTGDLGRWLPDGNIEYLGRLDDQVKIRGYRIELGEIEDVLMKCPLVNAAVVIKTNGNNTQLVGYVVPAGEFDKDAIVAFLNGKLPEYMIPALLIPLESLPLTANGKTDKKALPAPDGQLLRQHEYVAPQNETEQQLAEICMALLEVERISIYDKLPELGMHSLLMMRLAAALKERFGLAVTVRELFQLVTISSLAGYISLHQQQHRLQAAPKGKRIVL